MKRVAVEPTDPAFVKAYAVLEEAMTVLADAINESGILDDRDDGIEIRVALIALADRETGAVGYVTQLTREAVEEMCGNIARSRVQ